MNMKILIVTNGFPPTAYGGVEVYSFDLAHGLSNRDYQVTVLCRETDFSLADYHVSETWEAGIRVIRVVNDYKNIYSFRDTFVDSRIDAIFREKLLEIAPDIIHFNHLIALSARLPIIAESLKIPSIVTMHDFWPICHRVTLIDWQKRQCSGPENGGQCAICVIGGEEKRKIANSFNWLVQIIKKTTSPHFRNYFRQALPRLYKQSAPLYSSEDIFKERLRLFKSVIQKSQRIMVPSNFVKEQLISNGFTSKSIEVVPLGINIESTSNEVPSESATSTKIIRFAAIGSILSIKGFDVLINAFKSVPGNHLSLDLYGREDIITPYAKEIRGLAQEDPRIDFKGSFSPEQRPKIYRNIDVLVIPSRVPETFSLVCREALMYGKPVIASEIGALPEIISNGVNGFLFKPDDEEGLKNIIRAIVNDPGSLGQMQVPGPEPILTMDDHINAIEKIYIQVCRLASKPGIPVQSGGTAL